MTTELTWGGAQNMGDGIWHDYLTKFGVMGTPDKNDWMIVNAEDGLPYRENDMRYYNLSESKARNIAENLESAK